MILLKQEVIMKF